MTEQEQKAFDAMREALESSAVCIQLMSDGPSRASWGDTLDIIDAALTAANSVTSECSKVTSEYSEQPQDKAVKAAQASMAYYRETMGKGHPQATEPAWRPIESAPNGTMVLFANMSPRIQASEWCFVGWMAGGKLCGHRMEKPTHWMPLPSPPKDDL